MWSLVTDRVTFLRRIMRTISHPYSQWLRCVDLSAARSSDALRVVCACACVRRNVRRVRGREEGEVKFLAFLVGQRSAEAESLTAPGHAPGPCLLILSIQWAVGYICASYKLSYRILCMWYLPHFDY